MAMKDIGRDEEIELELGLSLGGNYNRQLQKLVPLLNGAHAPKSTTDVGCASSGGSWRFAVQDCNNYEMNSKTKREIQALRRQEAKKKRGKGKLTININAADAGAGCSSVDFYLNGGSHHDLEEPECKKSKTGISRSNCKELMGSSEAAKSNISIEPSSVPALPTLQLGGSGQTESGAISGTGSGAQPNVIPMTNYGFGAPFQGHDLEQSDAEDGSKGSAICTSSVGLDYQSPSRSRQGPGGSSDSRSHSMQSILEQPHFNGGNTNIKSRCEQTATSNLIESASGAMNLVEFDPHKEKEDPKSETDGMTTATSIENPETSGSKESDDQQVSYKPPSRSSDQCENNTHASLTYMPCVSTTGNGPNGKTVHGFLYKYTKAEVSIICVCHGTSFSPLEFVHHAGAVDVCHPLKHITVVPSSI